jgi:NAD(P)-dependent dehydrogenase (short-subunit alcohol dehydrogenase family)
MAQLFMRSGKNMEHLAGKVAVITGAGRGIGQRTAVRLAQMKVKTALVSRTETQLYETADLVLQAGGTPLVVAADLSDLKSIEAIKASVIDELGQPSILINAAGMFGPIELVWKTDPDEWIRTQMVNIVGAYLICHAFISGMMASGWGRVVNVTSAATLHEPGPINSAYGTSKAALNQFTRHLASEIAGSGVTANVIHPGDVKTDMWATVRDAAKNLGAEADRYREWARWVAETGGDDPEKASDLILALLGEKAASINGRFLWIKDGLQPPIPSWGAFVPDEAWR